MVYTSSTTSHRKRIVRQIELCLLTIKYGIPIICLSALINWFLDCCGVGMIY